MTVDGAKAIFFDLDGTLLDWETGIEEAWLAACELGCGRLHGLDAGTLREAIRSRATWFWSDAERAREGRMEIPVASRTIVRTAMADLGIDNVDVAHAVADDYRARRDAVLSLYEAALPLLESVRSRGLRTALVTNGGAQMQRDKVVRFGLARYFDCIVIEGEFGCGKPDERVFHHAMASCAVEPADAWMIGDNLEADIAPAVTLGLSTIWVNASGDGLPDGAATRPHRIVRSIAELL